MRPGSEPLARHGDVGLLILRIVVGARLVAGTLDNVTSWARMEEFAVFLGANGFPFPLPGAVVSAWAQFAGGTLLALGLCTRPAAALLAVNFAAALAIAHRADTFEGAFPALVILAAAVLFALGGPGRWSLDAAWAARRGAARKRAAAS